MENFTLPDKKIEPNYVDIANKLSKMFLGKEDTMYTISSDGKITEIVKDPEYTGGQYTKEVQVSDELTKNDNEKNYSLISTEQYDSLIEAYNIMKKNNKIQDSMAQNGLTENNIFTISQLVKYIDSL